MSFNRRKKSKEVSTIVGTNFEFKILERKAGAPLDIPSWKLNACVRTLESVSAKKDRFLNLSHYQLEARRWCSLDYVALSNMFYFIFTVLCFFIF